MTTNLLVPRKLENIHQELDCLRGRPVNPAQDIDLPPYAINYSIIRAIKRDAASYVADYVKKYSATICRFFYQETRVPQKQTHKTITVCPLLYYAIRNSAIACIRVLLQLGASAFQPSYIVEWAVTEDVDSKIEITEKPTISWLAELIRGNTIEYSAKVLTHFKQSNVDFTKPQEIRIQKLNLKYSISTKTAQYADVWHCIAKIIEKSCPPEEFSNQKKIIKRLRSGYAMDTLGDIKKPKIEEPKKPLVENTEKAHEKEA